MRKRVFNIVWRSNYGVEVVDSADTRKEAEYLIKEYKTACNIGQYYIKRDLIQ
tara:strand:- start:125 stop:283 length:159 start_codon:yes stop_codon:yes gene_type:complete